ncbi:hypothetical protein N657DRAFT_684426 [Parathielavia appendiculata]|uniref:non-specific serine/threonine protein kinase n=1 Tax=Parathielavia appendiculata TaxID=2587402 RepID=A0AAN6YZJ2_9PEZI|nr:hypothetical protein N657DRAFT_684426 [Parathielavia appendiculata]
MPHSVVVFEGGQLRALLARGADTAQLDDRGNTPLSALLRRVTADVVRLPDVCHWLKPLSRGADVDRMNDDGLSVGDYIELLRKMPEAAEVLTAIGELLHNTYQVIAKPGYGSASTTWLCRDLQNHRNVTLKIYPSGEAQTAREVAALRHINIVLATRPPSKHLGAKSIRTLLDKFDITRPKTSRTNLCLVFEPPSVSVGEVRTLVYNGRMPIDMVKSVAFYVLQAFDFLHHIQESNILFAAPRKVYKHHAIYSSRVVGLSTPSIPVLCDFGEARFGEEAYGEHAMPDLYPAPEILLRIGCGWGLESGRWGLWTNLFNDTNGGQSKSALPHMACMVSLLGPQPQDLLDMTPVTEEFLDKSGRLKQEHQVAETSLEG